MDFYGTGRHDILSGSWPGEIYLFRDNGDGTFAEGEVLKDREGAPINVGHASATFAAAFDGKGVLDLVVGTIDGTVLLVPNEGTRQKPLFGKAQPLGVAGEPIKVADGDAGPIVADWDGDGKPDLLVGTGSGAVLLFRNRGTGRVPILDAPRELIPASSEAAADDSKVRLGRRLKLCVADFNGDARPDLLVGDFSYEPAPARSNEDQKAAQETYDKLLAEYKKQEPALLEGPDDEAPRDKIRRLLKLNALRSALREASPQRDASNYHFRGYVWLFVRKDSAAPAERAGR